MDSPRKISSGGGFPGSVLIGAIQRLGETGGSIKHGGLGNSPKKPRWKSLGKIVHRTTPGGKDPGGDFFYCKVSLPEGMSRWMMDIFLFSIEGSPKSWLMRYFLRGLYCLVYRDYYHPEWEALSANHLSTAKYLDHYRIIYQVNEAISRLFSVLLAHTRIWTTSKLMPGQGHDTPWRKSAHGRTCPVILMGLKGFEA